MRATALLLLALAAPAAVLAGSGAPEEFAGEWAFVDVATGMEFVFVPGGTFRMGDRHGKPALGVEIGDCGTGKPLVTSLAREGPAEKAGVQRFDLIVEADGRTVSRSEQLLKYLESLPPGGTVRLVVERENQRLEFTVPLGERTGSEVCSEREDERPVHTVSLRSFFIGRHEVRQSEWERVMGGNPSPVRAPDLPVYRVSWDEAQVFARKLSDMTGELYRLPTEAEWEYAGGGAWEERWPGTSRAEQLGEYAWFVDNAGGGPHPVGTRRPNALGLHDMAGNVSEWCEDWYYRFYYHRSPRSNPAGPPPGGQYWEGALYPKHSASERTREHVARGGNFESPASRCRSSCRAEDSRWGWDTAVNRPIGLRLVRENSGE